MSPVHKSTREVEREEREREGKSSVRQIWESRRVFSRSWEEKRRGEGFRRRRNEFQPIPIKPSIEEANMNGSTSSSKDIDNFLLHERNASKKRRRSLLSPQWRRSRYLWK